MILVQIKLTEGKSSLEDDLNQLQTAKNQNLRNALIYTSNRKLILRSHVNLAQFILDLLSQASELRQIKTSQNYTKAIEAYKEMYLTMMASEKSKDDGYWYRRIYLRRYF